MNISNLCGLNGLIMANSYVASMCMAMNCANARARRLPYSTISSLTASALGSLKIFIYITPNDLLFLLPLSLVSL